MKLSILICRLINRTDKFERLRDILAPQIKNNVEVLSSLDNGEIPIGTKRNALMIAASGEYICFIDDDDRVSKDYISEVMKGIELGVDCCSLVGEITTNGIDPRIFVHSLEHKEYYEKNGVYYRPPNHLNVIKKSLVRDFHFKPKNFGEDTDWAMEVCRAGVLKTEYKIKKTIYFYDYVSEK